MNVRKWLASVLVVCLTVPFMGSCGNKSVSIDEGSGEIPKEISILAHLGAKAKQAGAKDFNDVASFRLMEELTGCHVNWEHPGSDDNFNLIIASGDLPDCIVYSWKTADGGAASYVEDGVILDLTKMVDKYMPNFKKYLEENPDIKKQVVTDDGRILYIPFIRKDDQLCRYMGPLVRRDWLDKLGLEVPKTTDDLYEVLKAFKTKDPNGNGVADEIPMTAIGFDRVNNGAGNLLWAFGTTYDFCIKGGKIIYGPTTSEFSEGLSYINKLYEEKLLDIDFLQNDSTNFNSKMITGKSGFAFAFQPTVIYNGMTDKGDAVIEGISYLTGPNGKKECYNPFYTQKIVDSSLAITSSNKNPSGTLKWLDNFFGGEGYYYMNFGEEGVSYDMVDGEPVLRQEILKVNEATGAADSGLYIGCIDSAFPALQDYRYYVQTLSPWGRQAVEKWFDDDVDTSNTCPALFFTADEKDIITNTMAPITTFMEEQATKRILGQISESEWEDAQKQINAMGIEDVLKVYNDAYGRYKKR